jgi:hypothetical protein
MRRRATCWASVAAAMLLWPALAYAQQPLASGQLRILGAQRAVSPASQTVPKNQASQSRVLGCYVVRLLGGAR